MKKLKIASFCLSLLALAACKKGSDNAVVSVPQILIGKAISNSATLTAGTYKGTMLANQTYTVGGDITINQGDTLLIQKGVRVNMTNGANFIVNGTLISLGTSDAPVTITDPTKTKTTGPSDPNTDPAYAGGWGGIYCGPTCPLLVIKWTHLDFGGYTLAALPFTPSTGLKAGTGGSQYILYFNNPTGLLILEDSWLYGSPDDATRFYGGAMNIMRNTMEKCGKLGGDGFNAKGSSYGNMAYNLVIGGATNGTKTASDNTLGAECQFTMYNNTYVNDGFRNSGVYGARSGSMEIENASKVLAYNNLVVDCDFGLRIAGGPSGKVFAADTATSAGGPIFRTAYGYNYYYADTLSIANQFVPTNIAQPEATLPQSTDIPNMQALIYAQLSSGQLAATLKSPGLNYPFGFIYDGSSLVGKNNPMFVNYPLPAASPFWKTQASVDNYNFRLTAGSPAIGKGTNTAFSPITTGIKVDPNFGSSEITPPGKDMGCYQSNGNGNHH